MKKCKPGYYYCNTDKKCKKMPRGYHVGRSVRKFPVATVLATVDTYVRRLMMIQKISLMGMAMGMVMVAMGTVMVATALTEMVEAETVVEWVSR